MRLPKSVPSRMPPPSVLRFVAFPPPAVALAPSRSLDGEVRPPRVPFRMQQRIKKAMLLAGLDPALLLEQQQKPPAKISPYVSLPKGSPRDVQKVEREFKILDNMEKMDERIRTWKEEKAKAKLAKKSALPF
ncbi:hypothetical protein BDR26DRAFT_1006363 [Obelidium mucronatum]|nr:hypothetical protein BDR26DRAFT_1006363 [Obelidium mucronatum]